MSLFKARRKAAEEFEEVLRARDTSSDQIVRKMKRVQKQATYYPPHVIAGSAANRVHAIK
jgi:hypothetical protein